MNRLYATALVSVLTMLLAAQLLMGSRPGGADGARAAATGSGSPQGRNGSFYAVDATVIHRDKTGQFHVKGAVNGEDVRFLVDTGADIVALTLASAQDAGIDVDADSFQPIAQTASGVGYGAPVVIDRLEIAGVELHDVPALVLDGLETDLLGQTVLRQLGHVDLRGDTMTIRGEG